MLFSLPPLGKEAIPLEHFPTRHQAFIFRAAEYIPTAKIAKILRTAEENVTNAEREMGLPDYMPGDLWLTKGYITVIRRMWHILPYEQLFELLDVSEEKFATILREEDFLKTKLGDKPICAPVRYRELTESERSATARIKETVDALSITDGVRPFDFKYEIPKVTVEGGEIFGTRMIYAFSGLYLSAFERDSREFISDEMLEAYRDSGINGIWMQGVLYQLTEFPFEPSISVGWEQRLERVRAMARRFSEYGIKLYLYLNEPRCMTEHLFKKHPQLKGHEISPERISMCVSTPEVKNYLTDAVETVCKKVPEIGGFFTITRSENPTNCYSHSTNVSCNCKRCSKKSVGEVIGSTIECIRRGADRVDPSIKVMAWSWRWDEFSMEIIEHLPKGVILISQSELDVPYEIGGIKGGVIDYSMGIIGPGERAKGEWDAARWRGLELGAKVQINTTWEASTVPALPLFPLIDRHIEGIANEGVKHILLSWTLGGYPSGNIARLCHRFFEKAKIEATDVRVRRAEEIFSEAFKEFPFDIQCLYAGPQNAGPSSLLFDKPTGYRGTMTCFTYDDVEKWRSVYPIKVYEDQFAKLAEKWKRGLKILSECEGESAVMARAAYCLFYSSLCQIRFYRAREASDTEAMVFYAREEYATAKDMLSLMNENAAIGFEAANHYYFSKGQLVEKMVNCKFIIDKYS